MKSLNVKPHYIFLTVISLLGFGLVYLTVSKYGIGVSNDAIHFLSAADNVAQGNGLNKFDGDPLILWPPLYSFIVGILNRISGIDTLAIGLFMNALSWGISLFLVGILFRRLFPDNPVWFYTGSLLMLASLPGLRVAVNFSTEPLFMVEFFLFLLLSQNYLKNGDKKTLYWMGALTAVSLFTRYNAILFALSGAILIIYYYRGDIRAALRPVMAFAMISGVPFAIWIALRNYPLTGTFLGGRQFWAVSFTGNFVFTYERMLRWFVPLFVSDRIPIPAILAIMVMLILAYASKKKRNLAKPFGTTPMLPVVVLSVIYYTFVVTTTITKDHIALHDDRYQLPLYAPVLILIFVLVQHLLLAQQDKLKYRRAQILSILVIVVWSIYPVWSVYKFVRDSREQGVVHYNVFNTTFYRESEFIQQMSAYEFEPGARLFSNEAGLVYYYTRLSVYASFYEDDAGFANIPTAAYMLENYQEWFDGEEAYLIWILPNEKAYYYTPELIGLAYDLETIIETKDGVVYRLRSR